MPEVAAAAGPPDLYQQTRSAATGTAAGLAGLLALGVASPGSAFSSMVAKFGLASICGYQTVRSRPWSLLNTRGCLPGTNANRSDLG